MNADDYTDDEAELRKRASEPLSDDEDAREPREVGSYLDAVTDAMAQKAKGRKRRRGDER